MGFNWKDFFYYPKNDRNAIIVLLLLIVICGVLVVEKKSLFEEKNALLQEEAMEEFNKFQNEMVDIPSPEVNIETIDKQNTKASVKKLVEGETIELNTATIETLKRIPGIGEEYARRIHDYKICLGGFVSIGQLKEIQGFSGKRFDKMISYVTIDKSHSKIKINKHSKEKLINHPYLSEKQINTIVEIRQSNGKINNFDELLRTTDFTPRDIERLSAYVSFD